MSKPAIVSAIEAFNPFNYVSISDPENEDMVDDQDDPEKILLKKEKDRIIEERYEGLSQEAKELLRMVLNAPTEVLDAISTPKHKTIKKDLIVKWLAKLWKDKKEAKRVVRELEALVKDFETLDN